jgi:hypothetical protein
MQNNIDSVDKETFERVWKVAQEIGVQERHFNGLQTGYRNMASVWLLATFSGLGFAISQKLEVTVQREFLIIVIAIAGGVGIALLWVLDLLVYHRLLDSCFIEGLILEERYSWLPAFRSNMMTTQNKQGVVFRTVGFYLAPIVLLILISTAALEVLCIREKWLIAAALSAATGIATALIVGIVILTKTENTASTEKRLAEARKTSDSA